MTSIKAKIRTQGIVDIVRNSRERYDNLIELADFATALIADGFVGAVMLAK